MQKNRQLVNLNDSFTRYYFDMLIICIALSVNGIYLNGIDALLRIFICSASAVLCEFVLFKAVVKKNTLGDLSALVTGMLIALMLPASTPLYIGAAASAFAIAVAKLPFGDVRNAPFVPAAAGFCFVAVLFSKEVFSYSASDESSLIDMLSIGDSIDLNIFSATSLLSGAYPGAVGTTSLLALAGAFCYICIRQRSRIYSALGYLLSASAFAFLFPRISSGRFLSVIMEICAGSLIFTALFLISEPATSPKNKKKAFIYGLASGSVCMLLRFFSVFPDPCCFGVLIMNALRPIIFNEKPVKAKGTRADAARRTAG